MALSADPGALASFTFITNDGREIALAVRYITRRQKADHARLIDQMINKTYGDPALAELAFQAIEIGVVGMTREQLDDLLDDRDLVDLATRFTTAAEVAAYERGKQRSRRLGFNATADSASSASADVATTLPPATDRSA